MGRDDQQKRSEEVRRLIIETTVQIIKEEEFNSVSIRKISDRMGYSTEVIDTIHKQADN